MLTIELFVIQPLLILGGLACAAYFLVVVPSRWRRPYEQSLPLLDSDDRDDLAAADRLLGEALSAGPRGRSLGRIRFAQAYARAMLGAFDPDRYSAAAAVLDELIATAGRTEDTAYLELWVQAQLGNHDRVVDLHAEHRRLLSSRPESGQIAAISHLMLAAGRWRRQEIDGAVHHFDQVRELGVLTDKIPPEVNNLHLAKGVQAMFDGRADDARDAFNAARKRSAEQGFLAVEPELGLLACDWRDGDPGQLGERLEQVAKQAGQLPAQDRTTGPLRASIAILRLVALLRQWADRPALSGRPSGSDLAELERCADTARAADPEHGDPYLITGLVLYYFALGQRERERALAVLTAGTELARAITLPEVLQLLKREQALGGEGDAISRYLDLIDRLLADPDRAAAELTEYRALRARYSRSGKPEVPDDDATPRQQDPLADYQRRAEALRRQIELIAYPRTRDLPEDHPARQLLRGLMAELDRASRAHAEGAGVLHGAELGLIAMVGNLLLPEEEPWEDRHAGPGEAATRVPGEDR